MAQSLPKQRSERILRFLEISNRNKLSCNQSCGISGRGKNKRGLASSALNQTSF